MGLVSDCESDPSFGETIADAHRAACATKSIFRIVNGWSFMLAWGRASETQRAELRYHARTQDHHKLVLMVSQLIKDGDEPIRELRDQAKKLGVDYLHSKTKQELMSEIAARAAVSGGTNGKKETQQDGNPTGAQG